MIGFRLHVPSRTKVRWSRVGVTLLLVFIVTELGLQYRLLRRAVMGEQRATQKSFLEGAPPRTVGRMTPPVERQHQSDHSRLLSSTVPSLVGRSVNASTADYAGATSVPAKRKWAYVFLVAGCSEKNPGYRGFLYNVAVAAMQFQSFQSKADVVVMVQMATNTDAQTLPPAEEQMLHDMGVIIKYLPKFRSSVHECFYATVMEKFRILEMVEYSRVLFIDADIMPYCSLDYFFELSEPDNNNMAVANITRQPLLKENVIVAWNTEAANAGFFMMRPGLDRWESLLQAIRRKEERALELPWPHWDEREGWGHVITPPDYWRGMNGTKITVWDWHAVFADQGLVYYWPKYVQKSVSIIVWSDVETWSRRGGNNGDGSDGEVYLQEVLKSPLTNYSCRGIPPYGEIMHFTGRGKPWNSDLRKENADNGKPLKRELRIWREALLKAQTRTNYTFSFYLKDEQKNAGPPLGAYSTYKQMIDHIKSKKFYNWNHYEDASDVDAW